MTESEKTETTAEPAGRPFTETVHRVLLASIGAVALAQEELSVLMKRLIERGEIAEKERRATVGEVKEKSEKQAAGAQNKLDEQIEAVLRRANLPARSDIEAVSAQVTELNAKLDELNQS